MVKAIIAIIIVVLGYSIFTRDDLPKYIEFQGNQFGPRELQKMLGSGNKGVIYMIDLPDLDIVAMLMTESKTDKPKSISEAEGIFSSLSKIQL